MTRRVNKVDRYQITATGMGVVGARQTKYDAINACDKWAKDAKFKRQYSVVDDTTGETVHKSKFDRIGASVGYAFTN